MHLPHTVQKDTLKINVSPFLIQVMSFALLKRKSKVLHSCIGYLERVTANAPELFWHMYIS